MKNPIFLDYTFLFDASDTWQYLNQFENDLSDYFTSLGYQATIVKSMQGQPGKRILFISKVDPVKGMPKQNPLPPGKQIQQIQKNIKGK